MNLNVFESITQVGMICLLIGGGVTVVYTCLKQFKKAWISIATTTIIFIFFIWLSHKYL